MSPLATVLLPLLLLPAAPIPAERKFDAEATAKAVAPFLDDRTMAVVHVDLTHLDVEGLYEQLVVLARLQKGELAEQKKPLVASVKKLTDVGARDLFIVFSGADLPRQPPFFVVPLERQATAKTLDAFKEVFQKLYTDYDAEEIGPAVIIGTEQVRQRLTGLKAARRPDVAIAFAAAGGGVARVVLLDSDDTRNLLNEALPNIFPKGVLPAPQPLANGLRWGAVKIDARPKIQLQALYQATNETTAKTAHETLLKASKRLLDAPEFRDAYPEGQKMVEALTPRLDGERLTISVEEASLAKFLPAVAMNLRLAMLRAAALNNMQQLGLAMHSYHDAYNMLPAVANFDKKNKPLLSWRVHILPFLEEEKLYKEFHLDEPWDSEHNKKLIARMPKVFANPYNTKLAGDGKTTYLGPVYKDKTGICSIFTGDKTGLILVQIPDGTSNTVMLTDVEDDAAVIWTKPDDLKLDPKDPHKSLSARHGGKYLMLFADGHVQTIPKKIDKNSLWGIFTTNGGEVVNIP